MRSIARLEARHLAFIAETRRAARRQGVDVGRAMAEAGDSQLRAAKAAARATTQEQERAQRRLVTSIKQASREAQREIAEVRRKAAAGLIPPARSEQQIRAIENRLARFGQRVVQTGAAANADIRKSTVRALTEVQRAASGGAQAQIAAARRVTESVRRARLEAEREMRRIRRDQAGGVIDGPEAQRQIAATEARFTRFAARVQRTSGATGRAVTREIGGSLRSVQAEARRTEGHISRIDRRFGSMFAGVRQQVAMAGRSFVAFGLVMLSAMLGRGAIQKAVELQDAMVGVRKTTGMSRGELVLLQDDLVKLSRRLGIGAAELAGYAEMAGQLGIAGRRDIAAFTEAAAKLAAVSDLMPEEAAERVAKIANAFQISFEQAGNLGSAINELSNVSAATAGDLADVGQRAGMVGRTFGLTADQVLGMGAALVDAGMESERAGTSLRNTLTILTTKAGAAATVAGMTEQAFRDMLGSRPLEALQTYLRALGQMEPQLQAIHIDDVFGKENLVAVQTLANNLDRVNELMGVSATAFRDASSLTREFEAKLDSFNGQWSLTRERLAAVAISIGERVLPAATDLLEKVNWLTASSEELADEHRRLQDQMNEQQHLIDLADKYDELVRQQRDGADVADQLKTVLADIAAAAPGFVTAWDDQGNAVGVYSDALRDAAQAARELYEAQQLAAVGEIVDNLAGSFRAYVGAQRRRDEYQGMLDDGRTTITRGGPHGSSVRVSTLVGQAGMRAAAARAEVNAGLTALGRVYSVLRQNGYGDEAAMNMVTADVTAAGLRFGPASLARIRSAYRPTSSAPATREEPDEPVTLPPAEPSRTRTRRPRTPRDPRAGLDDSMENVLADVTERASEIAEAQLTIRALEIEAMREGSLKVIAQMDLEFDERIFRRRDQARREIAEIDELIEDRGRHMTAAERQQLTDRKAQIQADADAEIAAMRTAFTTVRAVTLEEINRTFAAEEAARLRNGALGTDPLPTPVRAVTDREIYGGYNPRTRTSDAPDAVDGLLRAGVLDSLTEIERAGAALDEAFQFETTDAGRARIQALRKELAELRDEMERTPTTVGAAVVTGLGIVSDALGQMVQESEGRNKALFRAHQAVSIAQALVSTYQAAAEMLVPSVGGPPPLNYINAGLVTAAGLLRVNQMRKQKPAGGDDGERGFYRGGLVDGGEQTIRVNERGPEFVVSAGPTRRHRGILDAINRGADPAVAVASHLAAVGRPLSRLAADRLPGQRGGAGSVAGDGAGAELARSLERGAVLGAMQSTEVLRDAVVGAVTDALSGLRLTTRARGSDLLVILDNAAKDQQRFLPVPGPIARKSG